MKRGRNQRRRQGGGMNVNRAFDSNGPDVRIRGTASQIYEKYQALARDASTSGDRVKAENYLQHAEHYYRVIRAMLPAQLPQQDQGGDQDFEGDQPSIGDGSDRRPYQENGQASGGDDMGDALPQGIEQPRDGRPDDPPRSNGADGGREPREARGDSNREGERDGNREGDREGARDQDDRRHGRRRRRPHRGERRDGQQNGAEASGDDENKSVDADEVPA